MQKKLSELLLYEAGIADCPGQYERIIQIAYKVEKLEALAKRYEDAPAATFRRDWASDTLAAGVVEEKNPSPEQLEKFKAIQDRARVRIVLDKEG